MRWSKKNRRDAIKILDVASYSLGSIGYTTDGLGLPHGEGERLAYFEFAETRPGKYISTLEQYSEWYARAAALLHDGWSPS